MCTLQCALYTVTEFLNAEAMQNQRKIRLVNVKQEKHAKSSCFLAKFYNIRQVVDVFMEFYLFLLHFQ